MVALTRHVMLIYFLKTRIILFACGIPLIFIRCAIIRDVDRPNLEKLNFSNFRKLEGVYNNASNDTSIDADQIVNSLWYQISYFKYDQHRQPFWRDQKVKLQLLTRNKIYLELLEGGRIVKSQVIKGKIKDGYFYKRPLFFFVPFPPLVFGYSTNRKRFGLVENDLVMDEKENHWMFAILAGNSKRSQTSRVIVERNRSTD